MALTKKIALVVGLVALAFGAQAKVTVFAAASMTNALEKVAEEYKKVKPTEEIVFSFTSSSTLAKQIAEGAPADLFISADQKWMNFLADKKEIVENSRVVLVGNSLVMIAPKDSKVNKVDLSNSKWQDQLNGTYLSVGDPEHVPAGIYAKQAFTYLGQWTKGFEDKLARAKDVRAALALVEQAESPLGVVYGTDAAVSQKVKVVATFPAESHPPVEYPAAIIKNHDTQEARDFLYYLQSKPAKDVFAQFGFSVK